MELFRIDRQIVTLDELQSILTALNRIQSSLNDHDMDALLTKVKALVAKSEQNRMEESGETLIFDTNLWHGGGTQRQIDADSAPASAQKSGSCNILIYEFRRYRRTAVSLVLKFTARVRVRVEEAFGSDAVEVQDDGSLRVTVSYPDSQWMYGMIYNNYES